MLNKNVRTITIPALACLVSGLFFSTASAEYKPYEHSSLASGAVAVTGPGSYDKPGTTYMLTRDITSPTSPIFLGKDVTLDLNGYTVTYAAADYRQIPNCGFERGLEGWDISKAPGARVEPKQVHVFIGNKILRLPAGEEIVSPYLSLPVAGRSYYAICGVTKRQMSVSVYVEDESGAQVRCEQRLGDSVRVSCPVEKKSPRLGGGFVSAHLHGLPAGKYRVRVKAETDCLLDEIDIRPAGDVGIGIVENVHPMAHNDDQYRSLHCAFFDYAAPGSSLEPVNSIPRVSGPGTVTIRNGVISSGAVGVLSWGIQSTAEQVMLVLENVKITASGINTNAVDVSKARINNCRFEIDTPFIINRHVSIHAVVLGGPGSSRVSHSEFYGGQGCLTLNGERSLVHHNLFVNRQMVTNHYCVMVKKGARGSKIHGNTFNPEIGSGLEIYSSKDNAVFNNTFCIQASPPTCEYGHEEYSTTAIRLADYGAGPKSDRGCDGNRIYDNTFQITGRDFPEYPDYIPMAWAFFHSASAGETYVYDNEITVEHIAPGSKAEAAAFYIGGARKGGRWYNNRITTNVPAFWIASMYGNASNANIYNNTIVKAENAPADFKPVRMGWKNFQASEIKFSSNQTVGADFGIDATDREHSYSIYWTLALTVLDKTGEALAEREVLIADKLGREAFRGTTNRSGRLSVELLEYRAEGSRRTSLSPYTVSAGGSTRKVNLNKNLAITLKSM
jgi:hypothetical protein